MDSNLFYRARHERNRKEREERRGRGEKNTRGRGKERERERRGREHPGKKIDRNVFACSVDAKQPFDV